MENTFEKFFAIGTKVKIQGVECMHAITEINDTRFNIKVSGLEGSFQRKHIESFANEKYIKYISSIGLNVDLKEYTARKLAKVSFSKRADNNTWDVSIISGHTLNAMPKCGMLNITQESFSNLADDPYDDLVFARAAFGLFGATV